MTLFTVETDHQWHTSAWSAAHSARITYFCPFAVASGPCCCLTAFSSWKHCFCYCWGPRKSWSVVVPRRAPSKDLVASYFHGKRRPAHPHPSTYALAWTTTHWILLNFPTQPPNCGGNRPAWLIVPPCIYQICLFMRNISHFQLRSVLYSGEIVLFSHVICPICIWDLSHSGLEGIDGPVPTKKKYIVCRIWRHMVYG